jgi:AP-3 complex subunit beta
MDPPFTRIIKLDILTALALEPMAIESVLKELRSYVRSSDKMFVCAAIRSVGKVVELARIVYDRHGAKHDQTVQQRKEANRIALDCLFGLNTLTQASDHMDVVGECAMVMQRIILQLMSDASVAPVEDPNGVLGAALRRIILLLSRSLSSRVATVSEVDHSSEDINEKAPSSLEQIALPLGPVATASLLWIFGEWIAPIRFSSPVLRVAHMSDKTKSKIKLEVIRLVAQSYPDLQALEKEQGIHLASKMIVSNAVNKNATAGDAEAKLVRCCELVLSMGRVDVNPIVRDRARYESLLLDCTITLKYDREALDGATAPPMNKGRGLTLDDLHHMLLASKPAPSHLPLDDDDDEDASFGGETTTTHFRFGTLSSLVGHKAGAAYLPLPPWAEKNSPAALRDGSLLAKDSAVSRTSKSSGDDWKVDPIKRADGFYESADEDESNDGDEDDDDDEEESDDSEDDDDDDSEDDDEDESDDDERKDTKNLSILSPAVNHHPVSNGATSTSLSALPKVAASVTPKTVVDSDDEGDDSSSDDDDDSAEDDDSSDEAPRPKTTTATKEGNLLGMFSNDAPLAPTSFLATSTPQTTSAAAKNTTKYTSVAEELSGLVMAPLDLRVPDVEQDSSAWIQLVRPSVSGGLDLQVRFLRGPSKEQEARRLGLNPDHAGTVCLQVRLENM